MRGKSGSGRERKEGKGQTKRKEKRRTSIFDNL